MISLLPLILSLAQTVPPPPGAGQTTPPASAQPAQSAAQCGGRDIDLPRELAGWRTTGTGTGLDRSFQLTGTGGSVTTSFTVPMAGRYRIALDQPGWIDVVSGGRVLESVAHGHGPECSTIRKLVAFDLPAGTHQLRLTRLAGTKARAMIVSPAAR